MEDSDSAADKIWSKGDSCKVQWSGDNQFYQAKILKFVVNEVGEKQAVVYFDGFTEEDNETIPLRKLKKIKDRPSMGKNDVQCLGDVSPDSHLHSMFSPLTGSEEERRLSEKYSVMDQEEQHSCIDPEVNSPLLMHKKNIESQVTDLKRKKRMVATGGASINKRNTKQVDMADSTKGNKFCDNSEQVDKLRSPLKFRIPTGLTSSESENEDETSTQVSGFSDLDMERPYFPHITPCAAKEPFLLSGPGETPIVQVPAVMNQYLRDYQRAGIRFLYRHYATSQGAILADDMGLGKTVQVIGFLSAILGKTGTKVDVMRNQPEFIRQMSGRDCLDEGVGGRKRPALVIGPATVMYNWLEEFQTWGHFSVGKFHRNDKETTLAQLRKKKLDIVVTTYETCRDHVDVLNEFPWQAVIADEAHKIKSMKAEVTQALKKLNCEKRYGLTGTPLQNNLAEFWCILDWANSNCLGALSTFKNNVCKIIDRGQRQDATKRELAEARCVQEQLAKVKDKWMLRRTKQIIADQLPKKEELVVYCKMTELQSEIYRTIMSQEDMHYILTQREPCTCGSQAARATCCFKKTPEGQSLKALTFTYMHLLLKAANHVALLLPKHIASEKQMKYAKRVCEEVFANHPEFLEQNREASFRTLSDPKYCGKMKVLTGLLSVYRKRNSKILLFSYSTRLLNIIEQYVMGKGYEYRRLDGDTPHSKRVTAIREFNKDPNVFLFLISTKAGGVGLNLTGANVVIIFDPNWNPVHDLQAQDRAYRLGQVRDVKVYRLICSGTIEENIYLRQIYKQQRANMAVEAQNARRYFHRGELFGIANMFLMKDSDRCLTEDILNRNRKVEEGLKMFRIEEYVPTTRASDGETSEDDNIASESENFKQTGDNPSPVKRSGASHSGRAKPIVYDSESDSTGEDVNVPFTSFKSNKDRDVRNDKQNINRVFESSDGVHDSQVASTSKSGLVTKVGHSQVVQEELDDLWDSFNTVHDKSSCESRSQTKHNSTAITIRNSPKPILQKSKKDEYNPKDSRAKGTSSVKRTSRKVIKRSSSESDCSDIDAGRDEGEATVAKQLKMKTAGGKVVKGKSKQQNRYKEDEELEHARKVKVKRNKENIHKRELTKNTPVTKGVRIVPLISEEHNKGIPQSDKTDVSALLNATFESVSDVLDQCGVVHTHHNQRIIGSSKAEDHMSRCAMKDVYELHQHTQAPAMMCEPFSQSSEESDDLGSSLKDHKRLRQRNKNSSKASQGSVDADLDDVKKSKVKKTTKSKQSNVNEARAETIGNRKVLIGQTPKGIRKQHFTFMSHTLGIDPAVLAKQVIFSTPVDRIKLLRRFYVSQETGLDPVMDSMQSLAEPESENQLEPDKGKETKSSKKKRKPVSARSFRKVDHCSRRKSSSCRGVDEDTDSTCSDGDNQHLYDNSVINTSAAETQHKLIQPTLEADDPITSSDNETKCEFKGGNRRKTRKCVISSGSDTEIDNSGGQDEEPNISCQSETRTQSQRSSNRSSLQRGGNQKDGEVKGASDEGETGGRTKQRGKPDPPDVPSNREKENFDYLDELFF